MAKKTTSSSRTGSPVAAKPAAAPIVTAVRNSAVPPKATAPAARKSAPTYDQIALSAYYIWKSGQGGSTDENWLAAERQLRGA